MTATPFLAIGWQSGQLTGWGQFGAHFARTCTEAGYRVILPAVPDQAGILPMDRPLLNSLAGPLPETEPGWLLMAIGNQMEERPEGLPSHIKCAGIIFCEDTGAIDAAKLNAYDVIVAGSRWTERVLREKGVERVILAHQGYDERVFFPDNQRTTICKPEADPNNGAPADWKVSQIAGLYQAEPASRPVMVFSGGKLEFRKGQDIAVEAFRRFRQTPEGKDAILVTAWDNAWPATMDGIWLSGYVKGVPAVKNKRCEIAPWLVVNGLSAESVIDCGRLSPPELAQVLRSCTVGIFPNRAESGTNLVMVEALASGLPCIASILTGGHDDVMAKDVGVCVGVTDAIPAGCRLYQSTDGWGETDPGLLADLLGLVASTGPRRSTFDADSWSWSVRGPAMAEAILESAAVMA